MELNLQRPLLFFDIESTGLNIATDGIVELSFVKVYPGESAPKIKTWRIVPWDLTTNRFRPMNPSASAVNGVRDEDLVDENGKPRKDGNGNPLPKFIEVVEEIADWIRDSDLSGFNSAKFDLPMLAEEFERVKAYCESRINDPKVPQEKKDMAASMIQKLDINLHECRMVDVQTIYHTMEPRNLRAAYRFYCGGEDFDNAHTAEADTIATYEVLKGQLEMYREADKFHEQPLKNDIEYLANMGGRPKTLDYAGRIILKDGVPTVSFGKYRDTSVKDVLRRDRNYFDWIEKGEFTLDTKRQFRILREKYETEEREEASRPATDEQLDLLKARFGGF